MNISDLFLSGPDILHQPWQLGAALRSDVAAGGISIFVVPDYRGSGMQITGSETASFRTELYKLAGISADIPISDLGDLLCGKTSEDSFHILEEICLHCFQKNNIPIIIGGSDDLLEAVVSALSCLEKPLSAAYISDTISLGDADAGGMKNYMYRLLSSKKMALKNFHLIGYQQHLINSTTVDLFREMRLDAVRLSEIMNNPQAAEPFFRHADVLSVNCNAIENPSEGFSVNSQVNGINRREICGLMKEAGLGKNLKAVGIFNYDFRNKSKANAQLLAQMVWYLLDGLTIRKTHPQREQYETFWVLIDGREYAFQREIFSERWYFGSENDLENRVPCTAQDYEDAKKGRLNLRFL